MKETSDFIGESTRIALAVDERKIQILDPKTEEFPHELPRKKRVGRLIPFPKGWSRLLSSSDDGELVVWDIEVGRIETTLKDRLDLVWDDIAIPESGDTVAFISSFELNLWTLSINTYFKSLNGDCRYKLPLVFSSNSKLLALSTLEYEIHIWDVVSSTCLLRFNTAYDSIVCFSKDSKWLATVSKASNKSTINLCSSLGHVGRVFMDFQEDEVRELIFSWDSVKLAFETLKDELGIYDISSSGAGRS